MAEVELNKNKGTSKRQKTDEKSTHFAVQVYPSIFGLKKLAHYTHKPLNDAVG